MLFGILGVTGFSTSSHDLPIQNSRFDVYLSGVEASDGTEGEAASSVEDGVGGGVEGCR